MTITAIQQIPPNHQQPEVHNLSSFDRLPLELSGTHNTSTEFAPLVSPQETTRRTLNKSHIDWFKAVTENNVEKMSSLVESGSNINVEGPKGFTALVHVFFGSLDAEPNLEIAWKLLQAKDLKVDKSTTGKFYSTLQTLKQHQDKMSLLDEFQKIVKNEPELKTMTNKTGPEIEVFRVLYTDEEVATWQRASDSLMSLPQLTDTQKTWFTAIQDTNIETLNQMIPSSPNVNQTDHLGRSALWLSAYKGDVAILEILLASDGLIINKETAGEFYIDLAILRDCLRSGRIEKEDIRKALTDLTTAPYPSVATSLLEKVGGVSNRNTSMINGFVNTLIGAFCANPLGGAKGGYRS
jgi:hypothetical protein